MSEVVAGNLIERAEKEIADLLNKVFAESEMPQFIAHEVPENVESYTDLLSSDFGKGRIYVEYRDSSFSAPKGLGNLHQEEKLKFRCLLQAKVLRGPSGLYALIQYVKRILLGFSPTDCKELYLVGYNVMEYEQNQFQPYLEFECMSIVRQAYNNNSEPELGTAFKILNLRSEFNKAYTPEQFSAEFDENTLA